MISASDTHNKYPHRITYAQNVVEVNSSGRSVEWVAIMFAVRYLV